MHNSYHPEPARIADIKQQTDNIKLFRFEFEQKVWGHKFTFKPGQFIELSIPGFGEGPFAPCNKPGTDYIELCIRDAGKTTSRLHQMKIGDKVAIRGPYGNGWNTDKKGENLIIVVGGLGLVPLRTLILGKNEFFGKDAKFQVFYGARSPKDMIFRYEFENWRKNNVEVNLSIDKSAPGWVGNTGLVTDLLDKIELLTGAKVFVCGPPVMYKPVIEKLRQKGFSDESFFISLERRMHCGIGVCQHCAVGPYYTCKDGPVFAYNQLKDIPGAI